MFDITIIEEIGRLALEPCTMKDLEEAGKLAHSLCSFTDRDSYLTWVRDWVFEYSMASTARRQAKAALRAKGDQDWYAKREEYKEHYRSYRVAKGLLFLRGWSKQESAHQREARLALEK